MKYIYQSVSVIIIIITFYSCEKEVVKRDFFNKIEFKKELPNGNWFSIDSIGIKENGINIFDINIEFDGFKLNNGKCAFLNNSLYFISHDGNLDKYFNMNGDENSTVTLTNDLIYCLNEIDKKMYFLMIQPFDTYDIYPPKKYSVWVLNRDQGFVGFSYYTKDTNKILPVFGERIPNTIIEQIKTLALHSPNSF